MPRPAITDKIQGRHRDRLALVYIRQSTLQQVGRHPESTRLQYALAERAQQLSHPQPPSLTAEGRSGPRMGRALLQGGAIPVGRVLPWGKVLPVGRVIPWGRVLPGAVAMVVGVVVGLSGVVRRG